MILKYFQPNRLTLVRQENLCLMLGAIGTPASLAKGVIDAKTLGAGLRTG